MRAQQHAIAGPSRVPAQGPAVSESDAEPSETETEEQESSQELEEDEDAGLAPRAWTVVQICARRDHVLPGVDEYQVRWARTRHATAEFRISTRRGRLRARVGGEPWEIIRHTEVEPNRRNGEPETMVEWARTWHLVWELSSAIAAIAEFDTQHPRTPRQITMKKKPELRNWPMYLQDFRDPEPEPEVEDENHPIGEHDFEIVEEVDYTTSFLNHCKRELRNGVRWAQTILLFLCMPLRQRLLFNAAFARAVGSFKGGQIAKWKTIFVFMVGLAHRQPCTYCATTDPGKLPYPACVSWESAFMEACTNCAYAGSPVSGDCECRNGMLKVLRVFALKSYTFADGVRCCWVMEAECSPDSAVRGPGQRWRCRCRCRKHDLERQRRTQRRCSKLIGK